MRGKYVIAVAVFLLEMVATIPSASAASVYDDYYVSVDHLSLVNTACPNSGEDVSNTWSQYVQSSSWGSSFAKAQSTDTGSWGVSLLPQYQSYNDGITGARVVTSNAVIVYWSESSKMTAQWTGNGYIMAQTPDRSVILQLTGDASSCSVSVGAYGTGYISSAHGDVDNYFFNGNANYPAGYAGPRIVGVAAALNIATTVSDYAPWTATATDRPLVQLTATVTNASGAPAVGATVQFSNAPAGAFTVPQNGVVSVVEDVSQGVSDITVKASLGSATTTNAVHVFDATEMTQCTLPGQPRQTDAISSLLDNMIVEAPGGNLLNAASHLFDFISGIHTFLGASPEPLKTVQTATRYTGSFSTIYGLSTDVVVDDSSQAAVKTLPSVYSRSYDLVRPLFTGDGTPVQAYGRSLVCGPMA